MRRERASEVSRNSWLRYARDGCPSRSIFSFMGFICPPMTGPFELGKPFFQLSHCLDKLRQLLKRRYRAQPLACCERGRAAHHRARLDIASDAALRIDHGVVVNRQMAGDAHLSGEQYTLAQHTRSGQARLGANDVVLADHRSVTHLHEAVYLGAAAHARLAHRGPVDRRERLDFHVVLNHGDAALNNLAMRAIRALGEAESVAADDHAVLQRHTMPDAAVLAHHRMRVSVEMIADLRSLINHDMWMQHRIRADRHVLADHGERSDGGVAADSRGPGDRG